MSCPWCLKMDLTGDSKAVASRNPQARALATCATSISGHGSARGNPCNPRYLQVLAVNLVLRLLASRPPSPKLEQPALVLFWVPRLSAEGFHPLSKSLTILQLAGRLWEPELYLAASLVLGPKLTALAPALLFGPRDRGPNRFPNRSLRAQSLASEAHKRHVCLSLLPLSLEF